MDRLALRRVRPRRGAEDQGGQGRGHGDGRLASAPSAPRRDCASASPAARTRRSGSTRRRLVPRRARRRRRRSPPSRRAARTTSSGSGRRASATTRALVGPMFAELLGVPHVGSIIKLEVGEGKITAHREIEGAHEVVECTLPVVLTAQKGLNEPRYASLKGIMAAKKKTIAEKKLAELGVPEADPAKAKTRWRKLELPPARQAVKLVPGRRSGRRGQGAGAAAARRSESDLTAARRPSNRPERSEGSRTRHGLWRHMKFLVFIEQRDGKIRKASLEALSLARKLGGGPAAAVLRRQGRRRAREGPRQVRRRHRLRRRPRRARALLQQGLRRRARRGQRRPRAPTRF